MSTFVLIHGALHGAWCWEGVVEALRGMSHEAVAFDLPGAGADPTPRATVTFEVQVAAASRVVASHHDVVLVGHSLAGILLPAIAAANPGRIREVVFLAAYVLNAGERSIDLVPAERRPRYFEMAASRPDNTLWFDYDTARRLFLSDVSEEAARRAYERFTPQPFEPQLNVARFSAGDIQAVTRYILCENDRALPRELCLKMASKLKGPVQTIAAGHDAMLSEPRKLAEMLAP